MARARAALRVLIEPQPLRAPPWVRAPGKIMMRLLPKAEMLASTAALAPWPMLTMAMTAATPIIIPSMVRRARILFLPKERNDKAKVAPTLIVAPRLG